MKAAFVIDVDEDELGEAVATITAKENDITFFARGVIRPLPEKAEMTDDWRVADLIETESGRMARCYFKGYNACLKEITGEEE